MPHTRAPALTPDQWEARDYRQSARVLDEWAKSRNDSREHDSTEYVAKVGLDSSGAVVLMNRTHDRVLVPPPARAPLAAFALADQSFGFTPADVELLQAAVARTDDPKAAAALRDLAERIGDLLPPG
jgi:hypothetical protein